MIRNSFRRIQTRNFCDEKAEGCAYRNAEARFLSELEGHGEVKLPGLRLQGERKEVHREMEAQLSSIGKKEKKKKTAKSCTKIR